MCGEHADAGPHAARRRGSSPRVRGTLELAIEGVNPVGIIPACAGNTRTQHIRYGVLRDHPRVCGEHWRRHFMRLINEGSSPRVRGTRGYRKRLRMCVGIIPACAGNTFALPAALFALVDHPRVCGEHIKCTQYHRYEQGSSPRVRGTLVRYERFDHVRGIIPACAGNTDYASYALRKAWDHPRVCGEHKPLHIHRSCAAGSSPRVRGTPDFVVAGATWGGIIPACAGNTRCPSRLP